jgi:putative transposase
VFHIYNQGNNRGKIFYCEENYDYFLKKIEHFILPYVDILAWCLMPNHFHLMVLVRHTELEIEKNILSMQKVAIMKAKKRTLNDSIGIMLRSYTRGVNKQEKRSGSLFRNETKAVSVNNIKSLMPTLSITENTRLLTSLLSEKQYPQICFNYIHLNPVKAKLVTDPTHWKYSSAKDYTGKRKSHLTNVKIAGDYVNTTQAFT